MAKTKLSKNGKNDDFGAETMEFGQKLVDIRDIALTSSANGETH
jgi:hypothetical protein